MIENFLLYFWEFINRPDFAGIYLGMVALTCFWFGLRSLTSGEAVTFGLHGRTVTGPETARVGYSWTATGGGFLTASMLLISGVSP